MQGPYTGVLAQILHFAAFYEVIEAILCLFAQVVVFASRHYRHYQATRTGTLTLTPTPIGSQSQSSTKAKTKASTGSQADTETETDAESESKPSDSSLTLTQAPELDSESEPESESRSGSKTKTTMSKGLDVNVDTEIPAPQSLFSFSLSWLGRLISLYLRIRITRMSTYSPYHANYENSSNGTEYTAGYTNRVEYAIEPIRVGNVSWVWRNRVLRTDTQFQTRSEFNQDFRIFAVWFIVTFVTSCLVFQYFATRYSFSRTDASGAYLYSFLD